MDTSLYLTNEIYDLVNEGKEFREAYREVKESMTNT